MEITILQKGLMDCGPTCLLSVARFHGLNPDIKLLRKTAATNWTGTTLQGLIETAKILGFEANAVWANLEVIRHLKLPLIAHIKVWGILPHYLVIYKINTHSIEVMDPGLGKMRTLSIERFEIRWTKALIAFQNVDEFL